ncbi:MAG: NADH-quinone oxidoreductase subunit J [Pirellulales bacterium]|nr:NADH-quinone oxidoreductase subunit J [Pirellulales bacterium]
MVAQAFMTLTAAQGTMLASVATSAVGMWLALSPRAMRLRIIGAAIASAALVVAVTALDGPRGALDDQILFWLFAGSALVSSVFMVTSREPVYAALWFALATLGACGLFMLLSAPFLAAATVIVYAGAIIVTFLFVIMLAQQTGYTFYDQRARTPAAAIVASWLLLGALLWSYQQWQNEPVNVAAGPALTADANPNPFSQPDSEATAHSMRALGRSLFGDYLYAVEIAGTLLLVAAIGAIAIAPRRAEGTI